MRFAYYFGVGCVVLSAASVTAQAPATKQPAPAKPAIAQESLIELALRAEVRGDNAAREEFLQQALQAAPNDAAAQWHTGKVWHDGAWLTPGEVAARLAEDRRLIEYRNTRDDYPDTAAGQLELAHWCARQGLHDQKRSHLTRVLELEPNHITARRELGFRWVDGVWLSAEELAKAGRRAQAAERSLEVWSPKLLKLRDALERRNPRQQEIAMERLLEIKEPEAIPALEAVFGAYSEPAALVLVELLADINGADAAIALARQAVFSPSEKVRSTATSKLRPRRHEEFVPTLLSGLYTPIQLQMELYTLPNGRLLHRHAMFREGMDEHQVQVVDTEFVFWTNWTSVLTTHPAGPIWQGGVTLQEQARAQVALAKRAEKHRMMAHAENERSSAINHAISLALSSATGEIVPEDPQAWWRWWADRNEVDFYADKPVKYDYATDTLGTYRPIYSFEAVRRPKSSCLVAGTPVWTETGPEAIENLRPGDRVLAQDPDSGELTYKPVLKTTRRDPVETLCIDAGPAGTLTCSGGHMFWVSGKGWVRARVMEPGMILHTLDGPHEVRSVQVRPNAEVFNLIVADFHSYFVADGRWLTHDNTPQAPIDTIVPGLLVASR